MAEHDNEIDAIAENPEPATFENTIVAMEKAGETLNRLQTIFGVYTSSLNTGPIPDIECKSRSDDVGTRRCDHSKRGVV